jgi:uncharacterized protein (TIGR03435 family)
MIRSRDSGRRLTRWLTCLTGICVSATVFLQPASRAQSSGVAAINVEVASIKRNKDAEAERSAAGPGAAIGPTRLQVLPGGRIIGRGISGMELIREGYGYIRRAASDITGPGWLDDERYDVTIQLNRTEFGPALPWGLIPQEAADGVKLFLADRFKLQVRSEQKERTIYELRMARDDRRPGPGLTRADGTCVGIYAPPGPKPRCPFVLGGGQGFQSGNMTMTELAVILAGFPAVDTTVVDRTDLPGAFNVAMTRFIGGRLGSVADTATDDRPDIFTAMKQMLGLKLEKGKGLVDVIVVERASRPSED